MIRVWPLVCIAALLPVGCGSRDALPLVPVSGTVTYQGKLLEHGTVVFAPEQGTRGPQAIGKIDPDGRFKMRTLGNAGAAVGWHRVRVLCSQSTEPDARPVIPKDASEAVVQQSLIPEQYAAEDSPLRYEVKEGGINEYPIVLQ